MESNERYYARRAIEELRALERAITPEGKARRLALAEAFQLKALQCEGETMGGRCRPIIAVIGSTGDQQLSG